LEANGFDLSKFEFTFEKRSYSLLSIGSDKQMQDFKSRCKIAQKVIMFIQDESPTFFPAIKNGTYFDLVRITIVK
jgi:hypothetical protein